MALKSFYVKITIGTNEGPYDIYYDIVSETTHALLFGTDQAADNLTLEQLTTGEGVVVTVPDTASQIIIYNENELIRFNCDDNTAIIQFPTPTPTNTPTTTPTNTPTPSVTSTVTPTPTITVTPTLSPSDTPRPTPSNTPTNTPTSTPTNTPTNSPTNTPTPTNTQTPTPTNTPTNTPTPTVTPTPNASPTPTPTNTPTNTPTSTPTNTPTNTPNSTNTPTPTPTPLPEDCVDGFFDIVFVIDESGSVTDGSENPPGPPEYQFIVTLIRYIVDRLQSRIGVSGGFQFGFVGYTGAARIILNQNGNYNTISDTIDNLLANRNRGTTVTRDGINMGSIVVTNDTFKQNSSDAKIILLTDDVGAGANEYTAADTFKNLNNGYETRIIVVGLNTTQTTDGELLPIASSRGEYFSSTFQGLEEIADSILEQICDQNTPPPPSQTPTQTPAITPTPTPSPLVKSGNSVFTSTYSQQNADYINGKAYYSPANNVYTEVTSQSNPTLFWNMGYADVLFSSFDYPNPNYTKLPEGLIYSNSPIGLASVSLYKNDFTGDYWDISFNRVSYDKIDDLKGLYKFTLTNTSNGDTAVFSNIIMKAIKDGGGAILTTNPESRTIYSTGALSQPDNDRQLTKVNTDYFYSPGNIYKLEILSTNTVVSELDGLYWYVEPIISQF